MLFLVLLSTVSFAHAIPKVGDRAVYDVNAMRDGRAEAFTSVTELVKYDAGSQRFLERETRKIAGEPDVVEENWRECAEMLTDEKIDKILSGCREAGGTPTTVIVPAGVFPSCMLPMDADETQPASGWVWIAKVRFGIAKSQSTVNGIVSMKALRSSQ